MIFFYDADSQQNKNDIQPENTNDETKVEPQPTSSSSADTLPPENNAGSEDIIDGVMTGMHMHTFMVTVV